MNLHNGQSPTNIVAKMTYNFETNNEENATVFGVAMVRDPVNMHPCFMSGPVNMHPCFMSGPVNMHPCFMSVPVNMHPS